MDTRPTPPPRPEGERPPEPAADQQDLDAWLDQALDQTFPASDPVPWRHSRS